MLDITAKPSGAIVPKVNDGAPTVVVVPEAPPPTIRGRQLAAKTAHMTPTQKAALGCMIQGGEFDLTDLTDGQIMLLSGASRTYLRKASRATRKERKLLLAGTMMLDDIVPSITPKKKKKNDGDGGTKVVPFVPHVDDAQIIAFVRHIGVERVLAAACAVEAAQ